MSGVLEEQKFRIIFEFESVEQVTQFMDTIAKGLDSGLLKVTGTWSWGAESVQEFTAEAFDDDDDN